MQARIYEWYQIIEPLSEEVVLEKRKQAIESIIELVVAGPEWDTILECIVGIAGGIELLDPGSKYIKEATHCFKSNLLSFPINISDNAMELRIACGIILEELILRCEDDEGDQSKEADIIIPFLLSALGLRGTPSEKYLGKMINSLYLIAENHMERLAKGLRHRKAIDFSDFKINSLPTDPKSWENYNNTLYDIFHDLEQQTQADREEIEILWWLQNGISLNQHKPLVTLSPISAAIQAGLDVANLTILPPLQSMVDIIKRAVENNRKTQSITAKPFVELVNIRDYDSWILLAEHDDFMRNIVNNFPCLLPLTWLGTRIKESKGIPADFKTEFENRTGISTSLQFTPTDIANQIFREQITRLTYKNLIEE